MASLSLCLGAVLILQQTPAISATMLLCPSHYESLWEENIDVYEALSIRETFSVLILLLKTCLFIQQAMLYSLT